MNGSEKQIYEAVINVNEKITSIKIDIAEIKTAQKERHSQNISKFDILFKKINSIPNVTDVKKDVSRLYWLIFIVIILGILMKTGG